MSLPKIPQDRPSPPWADDDPDLARTAVYDPKKHAPPPEPDLAQTAIYDRDKHAPSEADLARTRVYDPAHDMKTRFGERAPPGSVLLEAMPATHESKAPLAEQSIAGGPLPPDAAEWMRFGRVFSSTIERAIATGEADLALRAAIARAWAAWQLGGYGNKQIGQVARLVETTWRAVRETSRQDRDAVVRDCATILHNGLPRDMRTWMPAERIAIVVDALAREPDLATARLDGVARLLGWTDAARAWGAEAIAIATGEQQ